MRFGFRIYIYIYSLVMHLHSDDTWIFVSVSIVTSQTFPGVLSWGAWISIPVSCYTVVLLDFFHIIDYNHMNGIKELCYLLKLSACMITK